MAGNQEQRKEGDDIDLDFQRKLKSILEDGLAHLKTHNAGDISVQQVIVELEKILAKPELKALKK
ncbi:MAG: hypothetical protein IJU37_12655 [Desulfovibrio sp.]|nr:hypothetical protein [Desulfovibrio sp.]